MIKATFDKLKVGDLVERNSVIWMVLDKTDSEDEKSLSLTYPGSAYEINNLDQVAFDQSNFYTVANK